MGRTKALVDVAGVPMALRVADALSGAGCTSVALIGGDPGRLAPLGLPVVPDLDPGGGPLAGIVTALDAFGHVEPGTGWVFVAACDLASLTSSAVEPLIRAARGAETADVVVARTDRVEPGCALWRRDRIETVSALYDGGIRAVHGALDALEVVEVTVSAEALRNINTPDDLGRYP